MTPDDSIILMFYAWVTRAHERVLLQRAAAHAQHRDRPLPALSPVAPSR